MLNLIKDYRQHDALHYSKLAALSKGYGTYVNKKYWVDQFAMNHGNAFECLLTYPEHFDTMFYISNEDNYTRGSATFYRNHCDTLCRSILACKKDGL